MGNTGLLEVFLWKTISQAGECQISPFIFDGTSLGCYSNVKESVTTLPVGSVGKHV